MFGGSAASNDGTKPKKERATPRIARTFPLSVACCFADTRLRPRLPGHDRESLRINHTTPRYPINFDEQRQNPSSTTLSPTKSTYPDMIRRTVPRGAAPDGV
jgi:hypothetical protein